MNIDKLSNEEKARLTLDMAKNADSNAKQLKNWVGNTCFLIEKLLDKEAELFHPTCEGLIWIRLAAILTELQQHFLQPEFLKALSIEEIQVRFMVPSENLKAIYFSRLINEKINEIRVLFTEEELIWIDNLRHTNSHILQKGYQLGVTKSGLKDTYTVPLTGKTYNIDELDQILDIWVKRYNGSSVELAKFVAKKIGLEISKLNDYMWSF